MSDRKDEGFMMSEHCGLHDEPDGIDVEAVAERPYVPTGPIAVEEEAAEMDRRASVLGDGSLRQHDLRCWARSLIERTEKDTEERLNSEWAEAYAPNNRDTDLGALLRKGPKVASVYFREMEELGRGELEAVRGECAAQIRTHAAISGFAGPPGLVESLEDLAVVVETGVAAIRAGKGG